MCLPKFPSPCSFIDLCSQPNSALTGGPHKRARPAGSLRGSAACGMSRGWLSRWQRLWWALCRPHHAMSSAHPRDSTVECNYVTGLHSPRWIHEAMTSLKEEGWHWGVPPRNKASLESLSCSVYSYLVNWHVLGFLVFLACCEHPLPGVYAVYFGTLFIPTNTAL